VVAALTTELLYQKDSYLREFYAYIIEVSGNAVILDKTAFHPTSGGVSVFITICDAHIH
jgi:misacylated tRNA(Ala) deacylase